MPMRGKYLAALLALVTCASAASGLAFAGSTGSADAEVLREARDRAEIEQLMWRYVRALDTFDAEAYAATYTADGSFGSGPNAAKGREALKKMITDLKQGRAEREAKGGPKSPPLYHVIANSYVEFIDHDHARLHSYWMTLFGAVDANSQPRVAAVGHGIDELVRTGGHWLIQARDVAPKDKD
jgi:hypothetical protein